MEVILIEKNNLNNQGLGFLRLTGIAVGATIGGGVFSMSGDMAASGANTMAVLVGWLICGIGMLGLMLCFHGLNRTKPELTGGIYSYAEAGFGDFVGFNSAWGYWISALLANVSYATLLFAAIGYFFPIFGEGNNLISIVLASVIIWAMHLLVLRGVKEASGVNLVITIAKIIPIFAFLVFVMFMRAFDWSVFTQNFFGEAGGPSFWAQVKATTSSTVWAFIGIEGAVVISSRAKKTSDVGKATVTAFLTVLVIYVLISVLSMGVLTRAELAELGNPPLAGILEHVVGQWGAVLVNLGVIISLTGATLGYTIIAAECPHDAAIRGSFTRIFAKKNKNSAPSASLWITNGIVQLFLIITYFNESTYQIFYAISASMIMFPYLLSALYYLMVVMKKEGLEAESTADLLKRKIAAVVGTIYGMWLLYASGVEYILISSLLYAPGIIFFVISKKERNQKIFNKLGDAALAFVIVALAATSIYMIVTQKIQPF